MTSGRREFMVRALYSVFALLGLGALLPGISILSPVREPDGDLAYFPLMPEDEVPRSGVKKAELVFMAAGRERKSRVFLVASSEGLAVLSAVCSHLGCLVNYRKDTKEFVCPCHGGKYDLAGKNIAGPPPAPLTRFSYRMQEGMLHLGVKVNA